MGLTRITQGVIKPDENYKAGIVTATQLDLNGNADISGDLNVGGVLTYEDVTSIDSVGIITAQKDIHVGAGISVVGVGSFGSLDISGDLDVDGHTNLDNVSISGVVTATSFVGNGAITINNNGTSKIITGSGNANTLNANVNLTFDGTTLDVKSGNGVINTGQATVHGDLDVDGHTNLDNVNVVGVLTASGGIRVPDGNYNTNLISVGGQEDFIIYHDTAHTYLQNKVGNLRIQADALKITSRTGVENYIQANVNGAVELYHNNVKRFETSSVGVSIPQDLHVDGHTNLDNVSIAGVATVTGNIIATGAVDAAGMTIAASVPVLNFNDTNDNPDFRLLVNNNSFIIEDTTSTQNRFVIGSTGNIGIGTNVAPHKLSVKGTISKISGTSGIQIVNISNDGSQNGTIAINQASGVERIKLHSNGVSYFNGGNVGIGSLVPRGKLDIKFAGAPSFITFGADADNPKVEFFRSTGGSPSHYATEFQQVLGDFVISTAATANLGSHSYSEKLRIKSNGSVGIGSDNPHRELVVGNNADMAVIGSNAGIYLGTHPTGGFQNNAAIARAAANNYHISGSTPGDLCIASESGAAMIFGVSHAAGAMDTFLHVSRLRNFNYYGADYKFHIGSTQTLTINSSGRVGINTTTDSMDGVTGNLNIANTNFNNHTVINLSRNTTSDRPHIRFQDPNGNVGYIGTYDSDLTISSGNDLIFRASSTDKLRITSDGKVGINQTPTRELSVHSPNNNNALIHFTNDDTGETASDGILIGLNGNEDCIVNNQESGKNIIFYTHNGSSVGERLRITSDGDIYTSGDQVRDGARLTIEKNVSGVSTAIHLHNANGSGTASKISCSKAIIISADVENNSPTTKSFISLHTDNSEKLRINSDSSLLHTRTDNVGRYDVEFRNTGGITDGNYGGIKFTQGSTGGTGLAAMEIAYANTGRPDIVFKHRDHGGGNSLNEAMRIDSNGYVTKPNNAMFKVQRSSNQAVTSNGWHIIQFNNDSTNGCFDVGSNFTTSNHRFTAPVNGYYHFGLNQRIDGGSGDYFRVAFSVDGDVGASDNYPFGHAIYRDSDGFQYYSFSISTLIYLTAGQYVRAEAYSHTDTSWTIQDESIFYGYLVG